MTLTLVVQHALEKLETGNSCFINIYCGSDVYNALSSYVHTLEDGKKIYFKLDSKKEPRSIDLELEDDKNITNRDDFFEKNSKSTKHI